MVFTSGDKPENGNINHDPDISVYQWAAQAWQTRAAVPNFPCLCWWQSLVIN